MGDPVQPVPPAALEPEEEQPVYRRARVDDRLWQGELLENVVQLRPTIESIQADVADQLEMIPVVHDLVVVMSQDCDLEQDFRRRRAGESGTLPNVLLCDVYPAEVLRLRVQERDQLGRADWKRRIAQNNSERFHYLQAVRPDQDLREIGLSGLALDFKFYFTSATDELYARLARSCRPRCILNPPYVEHLSHRFFKFQSRVALPRDHQIDPIPE